MAGLEELAAALMGSGTQDAIRAENPYFRLQQVPDLLSDTTLKLVASDPGKYSMKEALGASLASGLLSGILGGVGESYQNTLTDRYTSAVADAARGGTVNSFSLSPKLFGNAQNAGKLFGLQQALEDKRIEQELAKELMVQDAKAKDSLKQKVLEKIISNPRAAERSLPLLQKILGGQAGGTEEIATPTEGIKPKVSTENELDALGLTPMKEKRKTLYNEYLDAGLDDKDAAQAAKEDLKADVAANQKSFDVLNEIRAKAKDQISMADAVDAVLSQGLNTGFGSGALKGAASVGSIFGIGDETLANYELLDSIKAKSMGMNRVVGSGATSDFESKQYIAGGPSRDKTEEANAEISRRMRQLGERNLDYADFADMVKEKGGTMQQANQLWSKYERANPLWLKDENGRLIPNESIIPYTQFDFKTGKAIGEDRNDDSTLAEKVTKTAAATAQPEGLTDKAKGLIDAFGEGVLETPKAIGSMFNPQTYKEGFKDPVTGLETVGKGAAMTAGFVPGAAYGATAGSLLGPAGTVAGGLIGGGVGSALGQLGFNSLEEAASELFGVGTDRTVIPTQQEAEDAFRGGGQATGMAGVAKGLGAAAKGVKGAANKGAKVAENVAEGAKEDMLGVRPADIEKALDNGKIKYFDDLGNEVPASNATQYKDAINQAVEIVDQDGLLAEASNNPKQTKVIFEQKKAAAGKAVGDLHKEVAQALDDVYDSLSPVQKNQFKIRKDPKTGKGGFDPDFSNVEQAINEIKRTDPQLSGQLKKRFTEVKNGWEKTNKSYTSMQKYKESFGGATKWSKATTEVADAWNQIKQEIYKSFAEKQAQIADNILSRQGRGGELQAANAKYTAYKNLEDVVNKSASKGQAPLRVGILATPKSVVTRYPKTTMEVANAVASKANPIVGGISTGVDFFSKYLDEALGLSGGAASLPDTNLSKKKVSSVMSESSKPKYSSLIDQVAQETGVEPQIIRAMVAQESAGNPTAESEVGARGLMQLMPATAKEVAGNLGLESYDLNDPYTNLLMGATYYKQLADQFGDPALALTAYHSGPGRVAQLLEKTGGSSLTDIIDRLGPVGQKYAKQVLARISV